MQPPEMAISLGYHWDITGIDIWDIYIYIFGIFWGDEFDIFMSPLNGIYKVRPPFTIAKLTHIT